MPQKLGFYELLEPHFTFGLVAENAKGTDLKDLQEAGVDAQTHFPGASDTFMDIVNGILDYLSVEELFTAVGEEAIVYRGTARFGGKGRANPDLPEKAAIASTNGQELEWLEDMMDFRLTVPRRATSITFDTADLEAVDLADLQALNTFLPNLADNPAGNISDEPGTDFRLELLIRSVRITLPKDRFKPAKVAPDGWLEPDPDIDSVVFEFPRLAFVLEQQDEVGNVDFSLKSWDASGFDDPGDPNAGRLFSLNPPHFLFGSGIVGIGIDRLVADFSDDVTPPEILEQFGIGDDFNGIWLPLMQIFIAPGRTEGLAFSARGRDLLFDLDKGFSGEVSLDLINRIGKELVVEPIFYQKTKKAQLEFNRGKIPDEPDENNIRRVSKGSVSIAGEGEMHLAVRGTHPPYLAEVKLNGNLLTPVLSDQNTPRWQIGSDESGTLEIKVTDNNQTNTWLETVALNHVPVEEKAASDEKIYQITFEANEQHPEYKIELVHDQMPKKAAEFSLTNAASSPVFIVDQELIARGPNGNYTAALADIEEVFFPVKATWSTAQPIPFAADPSLQEQIQMITKSDQEVPGRFRLYFEFEYPLKGPTKTPEEVADNLSGTATFFGKLGLSANSLSASRAGINGKIDEYLNQTSGNIHVYGFASHESDTSFDFDDALSAQRAATLKAILEDRIQALSLNRQVIPQPSVYGHQADQSDTTAKSDARFRVAVALSEPKSEPVVLTGRVKWKDNTPVPSPPKEQEAPPPPTDPDGPSIFRRLGIRFRFERSDLVLGEISGQLDFNTSKEETLNFVKENESNLNNADSDALELTTSPGANATGEQGILDYRLTISYDTATRRLSQELAIGVDQAARDGRLSITKNEPGLLANTFGSLLVFAPLLNAGIDSAVSAEGDEAIADLVIAGAEIAIAAALGLTGAIEFRKWTLFGIELSSTQLLADGIEQETARFGHLSVLFDYAVDFVVDINLVVLTIRSKKDDDDNPIPTRVRYRGFGFRLNAGTNDVYEPVFDTSKGFELGLAEPGALEVDSPLGPILKVIAVRVGRENPLIMEFDLGLNANLGVISVDTVRVRIPVDPPGLPTIIPTAISVDIPGALVGSGYLDIRDSGFTGALDVTLVPLKLRIQASVGLKSVDVANRRISAFFMSLGAEFASALPLGGSGLGLYGLLGLFGMHYKRDEVPPTNPNLPIALDWFYNKAKGEPHLLAVEGRPTWIPEPDRWSFGLGVVLGTMEGGFILNLKGMLVLDLPGPRILIFVKALILEDLPPSGPPANETTGILAVVDLNFQVGYIAVGLMFHYEIQQVLKMEIPIDSSFSFNEIEDWHLYIGSLRQKASAEIFGITTGTAYLMFDGQGIPDFPLGPLNGFSIAAGIAGSLELGDRDIGLYAEIAGALDMGLSTSPLHFYGRMHLEGSIHLWIMSIGASATFTVEAPNPVYVKGEVCGSIDLWLTTLKGCIDFEIGTEPGLPAPAPLVSGLSIQSHSPVLVEGQGTDQPIDSSLGLAEDNQDILEEIPIDAIPVLQMQFPPIFAANATGLQPGPSAPTLPPNSDGWFSLGGLPGEDGEREARYEIKSITISPPLPDGNDEIPVTWWQPTRPETPADSNSADKGVNLALNSWIPFPFPKAFHRSDEQREIIRERFEVICRPVAPPAALLWTFNDQAGGPSPSGWTLQGIQWPDPPDTYRQSSPDSDLQVEEPLYPFRDNQLVQEMVSKVTGQIYDPARVIPSPLSLSLQPLKGKALRFPFLQYLESLIDGSIVGEQKELVNKFLAEAGDRERLIVHTGDAAKVRILFQYHHQRKVSDFTTYQAINADGQIVEDGKITGQVINTFGDLPNPWQQVDGPWRAEVEPVYDFLVNSFKGSHKLFLFEIAPAAPISRIEFTFRNSNPEQPFNDPPPLILGVIEVLPRSEEQRFIAEKEFQVDQTQVVVDSLQESDKRPLFAPDTLYTINVNYDAFLRKKAKPNVKKESLLQNQSFRFRTTAKAPKRLAPWVLAMSPPNDEETHFVEDPIHLIFNDLAVIQLFEAYGQKLKAVFRKANGNHPPEQPTAEGPAIQLVPTAVHTPFEQSMLELAEQLPCIPGIIETEKHAVFTIEVVLERSTEYTLDIEPDPMVKSPDEFEPLYRTAFKTSRFLSAAELAGTLRSSTIQERVTQAPLALDHKKQRLLIPVDGPVNVQAGEVEVLTDAEMEAALQSAFGSDLPPARDPGFTFLWSSDFPARPLGFLIDAPERLLRQRLTPVEVTTPTPDDDAIQYFRMGEQAWLELVETSNDLVHRIVYTSGACRAIVLLKPNATGRLQLALRQYRHSLMTGEPVHQDYSILDVALPSKAPWED